MLEQVATVGIRDPRQPARKFEALMQELRRLVETAGGEVVMEFQQPRERKDPATLVGKGKIDEVSQAIEGTGIRTVVFDDDLTAAQQKNIEKMIKAKIVDRTRLILDIFAQRAKTREGQLQIELAQLNYVVPRLTGAWRGFSQQSGGIGMRGPGERKIEIERRHVRQRIKHLKKEIEDIRHHRGRARGGREAIPLPQIAMVGYTNVGKSTLLNALVGETAVYADDKLFATLDPTTRRVKLPAGRTVLFTDTVGFIQKLPHDLVAAFRATLEEAKEATLLLHIVDATAEDRADQEKTVMDVIHGMKANEIPMVTVINKADGLTKSQREGLRKQGAILVSARTGEGLKDLLALIEQKLDAGLIEVDLDLPHEKHALVSDLYRTAHILKQTPTDSGTRMRLRIDRGNWERIAREAGMKGENA